MSLNYNLILNSQNAVNIVDNSNLYKLQYNINWDACLPRKFQDYILNWTYKSVNLTTNSFTATMATTTLTVTTISGAGVLAIGSQFYFGAVLISITALGTGIGGIGTYTISPSTTNATATLYNTIASLNDNLFVDVNFGANNTYDQSNQMSAKLGFIYPNVIQQTSNTFSYYYQATFYDNPPLEISYPSTNVITVNIYKFNGAAVTTNLLNYVLQLSFTPINKELLLH